MVVFHEFGKENEKVVVLIHPAGAPWTLWRDFIAEFEKDHHVLVPSLEGRNGIPGERFTTIENNARQIVDYLKEHDLSLYLLFGVSGGAAIVLKILAMNEVNVRYAIADAAMVYEKADPDYAKPIASYAAQIPGYGEAQKQETLEKFTEICGADLAKQYCDTMFSLSPETMYNEYYAFFTFTLPEDVSNVTTKLGLWYGEEETEKIENASYVMSRFPNTGVKIFPGYGHAEYWLRDTPGYIQDIHQFTCE